LSRGLHDNCPTGGYGFARQQLRNLRWFRKKTRASAIMLENATGSDKLLEKQGCSWLSGLSSGDFPKLNVEGSNPFTRSDRKSCRLLS
jgi:hypothetical protein